MNFQDYLNRRKAVHGDRFDASDLAPQFIPYLESGERIEVEWHYGGKSRGTIGVTVGWKPVFLLMTQRDSSGSMLCLSAEDKIVKVIPERKRR